MNTALATLFLAATIQHKLPANLLSSICYVESKHNPAAIHHDDGGSDSIGACQLKLKTARWLGFRGTEQDLLNPGLNIHYAGLYLKKQLVRYHGDITKAVIAYNIGNTRGLTTTK